MYFGYWRFLTRMLPEIQVCWDVNVYISTVLESRTACLYTQAPEFFEMSVTIYELRTALFWVITQRVVVISYREDEITTARCVKAQESADLSHFAMET